MANSEFKAAVRTFYREKSYAVINLAGLSLAIACGLVLGLYLRSELTYDQHHLRHREIFRIVNDFTTSGSTDDFAYTSLALGPLLKDNYPEVRDFVRFQPLDNVLIRAADKAIYWENVYFADENVFDIFTHQVIYGDPRAALKDPASAAVSETFAKKYFGDANPIGKTIDADLVPRMARKITLVFRDLPENTHLKYDVLLRLTTDLGGTEPRDLLFSINYFTYLLMPENYNVKNFKAISDSFFSRFMEARSKAIHISWSGWLQPLADIHLHSGMSVDLPTGNIYYVYGFFAVAVIILLIACINYVNLAIARAAKRKKEIAMRKILGVPGIHLLFRFLGEAVLYSLIAMIFGIALLEAAVKLTPINELLGMQISLGLPALPALLLWALGLSLAVGLLSGLYPAFYLSSVAPLSALASAHGKKWGLFRLREFLVLAQFTISVAVIACALIMALQMRFISNKPLGFDKHNRVLITLHGLDLIEKYPVIKNELLKNPHILGVTASSGLVGTGYNLPFNSMGVDNKDGVTDVFGFNHTEVETNYLEVMAMELAAGRNFSRRLLTDVGTSVIVNEAMVKARGWNEPLGKRIQGLGPNGGKVIGVAKDFHLKSMHTPVAPFAMRPFRDDFQNVPLENRPAYQRFLILKIAPAEVRQTLQFLQNKFADYDPRHPFEYKFLDDSIHKLYLSEERLMKMVGIFSGICIFISCLGLFGIAAFTTEQRSKEIGIRKVLGASPSQIIIMLAHKTLWLVFAGSVVASIAAYFAIDEWLSSFAYHVGINPVVFVGATAAVILVAFITIALQSYKTAQTNPAQTLRYE